MTKIWDFIKTRILAFVPTILGFAEVAVKFLKELLTLVADILFPIIPSAAFKNIVNKIRAVVDAIYNWISDNKAKLLAWLNLV